MSKEQTKQNRTWGTWEELLLACAVKRHGLSDWDSVAMEVQSRTSLPHLLTTAQNCRLKYNDLSRRFTSTDVVFDHSRPENGSGVAAVTVDDIPWLDQLRKLRVDELRQELERYDVSILYLKVKELEEEREQGLKDDEGHKSKSDLEDSNQYRSENDKSQNDQKETDKNGDAVVVLGGQPDPENHSVKESNSTGRKSDNDKVGGEEIKSELEQDRSGPGEDGPVSRASEPVGKESESDSDSDKGSSDTVGKNPRVVESSEPSRRSKADESSELRDSAAQSKGETRESGEVQSSASLTRKRNGKRRRRKEVSDGSSGGEEASEAHEEVSARSRPLFGLLQTVRTHQHGSLFERRLQSQETDGYNNMIRKHLDLKAIETKLQKGSYSSCALAFYRDLLILFTNATIFFPKSSLESIAAYELRQLVSKELKKNTRAPGPDPSPEPSESLPPTSPSHTKLETSDLFLPKNKPNVPIIVCRKRSSISSKPSSSSFAQKEEQQSDEKKPVLDLKPPVINPKEKPVTGTRSSRRSKENVTNSSAAPAKKQSSTNLGKMEKKKPEALPIEKKRSAADFLKRIKRNSRGEGSGGEQKGKDGEQKGKDSGKGEKGKERVLRPNGDRKAAHKEKSSPSKRSVGRPPKKAAETNAVSSKRSREGGGKETSKRPRKRSRR
ncbi:hypothetical protein FEM48_Zijuj01G0026200 [Ziziphus jujuba var. spinosa]|uniref:Bromo domain-containing protein n=1 Tax=Ziziphus jujuba var. spinosa TaxID=714518 RepID=A0A978VYN0_ZIZJJ|nr:hypothetical protein FEM48_Zijuj01G0026200 [Ziziphus jujuba var. spinosa]